MLRKISFREAANGLKFLKLESFSESFWPSPHRPRSIVGNESKMEQLKNNPSNYIWILSSLTEASESVGHNRKSQMLDPSSPGT